MRRLALITLVILLGTSQSAGAVLVYQRVVRGSPRIVVARDDGSHPRVIASGFAPLVSPDGRKVAFDRHRSAFLDETVTDLRVVSTRGGRSRFVATWAGPPQLWNPDNRRVLAFSSPVRYLVLYDTRGGTTLEITNDDVYGVSFTPNGRTLAFGDGGLTSVGLIHLGRSFEAQLAPGAWPLWGCGGLVYEAQDGDKDNPATYDQVVIRRPFSSPPRVLISRQPAYATVGHPVACSADGKRVLVARRVQYSQPQQALIVSTSTGATHVLPELLTSVDGLSRDGRTVLAEQHGNVVSIDATTGRAHVLAVHAQHASRAPK